MFIDGNEFQILKMCTGQRRITGHNSTDPLWCRLVIKVSESALVCRVELRSLPFGYDLGCTQSEILLLQIVVDPTDTAMAYATQSPFTIAYTPPDSERRLSSRSQHSATKPMR